MQNSPPEQSRLIVAVVLCLGVLLGWNYLFPPPEPQVAPQENASAAGNMANASPEAVLDAKPFAVDAPEPEPIKKVIGQPVTVDGPLYKAIFNTAGGFCTSFQLHNYKESIEPGSHDVRLIAPGTTEAHSMGVTLGQLATWHIFSWGEALDAEGNPVSELILDEGKNATLTFVGEYAGVRLTRTLTFDPANYYIDEQFTITNISQDAQDVGNVRFTMAVPPFTSADDAYDLTEVVVYDGEGLTEESDREDLMEAAFTKQHPVQWGGVMSNYFLAAITPDTGRGPAPDAGFGARYQDGFYRTYLSVAPGPMAPGAERTLNMGYYIGPKDQDLMAPLPGNLAEAVDFGFFNVIAKPLLWGIKFFHGLVGNWGVAIMIVTIIIKIIFWPLSQKSYKSMEQMKKLQPMMAKIREKHGDDRQKMNEEMMNLYKTYKVNPAGGCLPMLLQIPVFIGLYQALLAAIQLRHAPFISHLPFTDYIWLADLSAKDPYYITPIIMGASMFLQQKLMPAPGDPMQAKIMLFLPVIFTFMFLNFPSGLVLYWLVNNILSIAQQKWMLRNA